MESEREGRKRLTGGDSGAVSELPTPSSSHLSASNFTMGLGGEGESFYEEKAFDISVLQAIRAARQLLGLMACLAIPTCLLLRALSKSK